MAQISNLPTQPVVLRVAARKSFSFAVHVVTTKFAPVTLDGSTVTIVMKSPRAGTDTVDDAENLITNSTGTITNPTQGYARFDLQATDLDVPDGEYPFIIVLTTPSGYSIPAVQGVFDITYNPEYASLGSTYDGDSSVATIDVILKDQHVIKVSVGSPVPPGYDYLSDAEREMLNNINTQIGPGLGTAAYEDVEYFAIYDAGMPPAGARGSIPHKNSDDDYDVSWVAPASVLPPTGIYVDAIINHGDYTELVFTTANPLDATGITAGHVPTANGADAWAWAESAAVIGSADDITDGSENVMMTVEERDKLASLEAQVNADWDASTGVAEILNKPTLVDPDHTHRFLDLDGVDRGPIEDMPDPGEDGDVYIVVP